VKDQIKKPRPDLAARLEREVKQRWQPQIRAKAKAKAESTASIVIDARARMGYTAPIGSTDRDSIRHLTVALPPIYAARLFEAQEQGAGDHCGRSRPKRSRRCTSRTTAAAPALWRRSGSRTSSTSSSTCRAPSDEWARTVCDCALHWRASV
jgi:hypothetical protein